MSRRRYEKFSTDRSKDSSDEDSDSETDAPKRLKEAKSVSPEPSFGPALPPHLFQSVGEDHPSSSASTEPNSNSDQLRPAIGPVLPPHLRAKLAKDDDPEEESSLEPKFQVQMPPSESNSSRGVIGPALPHNFKPSQSLENSSEQIVGAQLPPGFLPPGGSSDDEAVIGPDQKATGPQLPPGFVAPGNSCDDEEPEARITGPQLPPGFIPPADSGSSDEDVGFGPDPRLMASGQMNVDDDFDKRAERARKKMLGLEEKKVERESWMLELPSEKAANLGLGARQFRAKLAPEMGDRSVWTDLPADKSRKEGKLPKISEKDLMRKQIIAERDKEMEKMAKKAEKKLKRKESLLESHSKKMKKKAEKEAAKTEGLPTERKRFSREDDMQVHRFDEAQKKAIFKKAQFLNDRFSQGESKFL